MVVDDDVQDLGELARSGGDRASTLRGHLERAALSPDGTGQGEAQACESRACFVSARQGAEARGGGKDPSLGAFVCSRWTARLGSVSHVPGLCEAL